MKADCALPTKKLLILCGKINKELVNLIEQKGGKAMGLSGIDGCMIHAVMKDEKLGFVGNITGINTEPIDDVVEKGYIPVIAGIGSGEDGSVYGGGFHSRCARRGKAYFNDGYCRRYERQK